MGGRGGEGRMQGSLKSSRTNSGAESLADFHGATETEKIVSAFFQQAQPTANAQGAEAATQGRTAASTDPRFCEDRKQFNKSILSKNRRSPLYFRTGLPGVWV